MHQYNKILTPNAALRLTNEGGNVQMLAKNNIIYLLLASVLVLLLSGCGPL